MLLLGGPAHGQERTLDNGESELTIMAPSPDNPLPMPYKYRVRTIESETRPGVFFRRDILVEQTLPIDLATQGLAQILLLKFAEELVRQFMEGGTQVADENEESRTSPGGIIIAR